ncbi:MAG: hypothetical protein M3Y72_17125 [Acidobacteriota bacterium]|nr:hypothetical protein [Acidobacteriota bacterium]
MTLLAQNLKPTAIPADRFGSMQVMRRLYWLIFGALTAAFLAGTCDAQHYTFKEYIEGLGNLNINCIVQDRAGFLWLGSENGLFRYDGSNFTEYGRSEGLPGTFIRALQIDAAGRLWVGTTDGLAVGSRDGHFREVKFRSTRLAIPYNSTLSASPDGRVFAITQLGVVVFSSKDEGQTWDADTVLSSRQAAQFGAADVKSVSAGADGSVLFGCGNGVCQLSGAYIAHWGIDDGLPKDSWVSLLRKKNGEIWARSKKHLAVLSSERKHWEVKDPSEVQSEETYLPLAEDRYGRVLAGFGPSVAIYGTGGWQLVSSANGLGEGSVGAIFVDRDGLVWLGTLGHGLRKWIGYGEWEHWTKDQGLPSNEIWSMARDSSGGLWVGHRNGISLLKAGRHKLTNWPLPESARGR